MRSAFLLLALAVPALAQPAPRDGLDLVPPTSFAFVTVRAGDLRNVESLKPLLEAVRKIETVQGESIEQLIGVPLSQVERITAFWPAPPTSEAGMMPVIVVTTTAPYSEAKVLKALRALPEGQGGPRHHHHDAVPVPKAAPGFPATKSDSFPTPPVEPTPPKLDQTPPKLAPPPKFDPEPRAQVGARQPAVEKPVADKPAGGPVAIHELFFRDRGPYAAVYLLDDRTIVMFGEGGSGPIHLAGQLLRRSADGPLSDALAAAGPATVAAGMRVDAFEKLFADDALGFPPELVPYRSLLKAKVAAASLMFDAKATARLRLTMPDANSARRAEPVLKTLFQNGSERLAEVRKETKDDADLAEVMLPLIDLAMGSLDKAEVAVDGVAVTAKMEADVGPAIGKAIAALPAVLEGQAGKMKTSNNLKQIAIAVHNYHDAMGFMPQNITGPDGKVLMSWRVALLPYLEHDNIFRQLDMTKSWDDPVNARLLEQTPLIYQVHGRDAGKGKTFFQMPSSPRPIPGGSPVLVHGQKQSIAAIPDGTSNTLLVVEAEDAVSWAKPDDLTFDPKNLPKLGDPKRGTFHAAFGDGHVDLFKRKALTDDVLRALLTKDGGEVTTIPR